MPDFTQKHFVVISTLLANERRAMMQTFPPGSEQRAVCSEMFYNIVDNFIETFDADNPRFDAERFKDACDA